MEARATRTGAWLAALKKVGLQEGLASPLDEWDLGKTQKAHPFEWKLGFSGGRGVIGDLEPWVSHMEGIRQSHRSGKQGLKAKPSGRESLVSPHHRLTFLTLWFIILWKVDIPKQMGEIGCTLS